MAYIYQEHRATVFTEAGQVGLLKMRDFCHEMLDKAGAVTGGKLIGACGSGDSWTILACVDRLVELGEIKEVTAPGSVWAQHRVFVSAKHHG